MKLTIAILGILGMMLNASAKPVAKRVMPKAVVKSAAKAPVRSAARPVSRQPAKTFTKAPQKMPVRAAHRAPAQAAPEVIPPKPEKNAESSKPSFNDTARLASSIRSMTTTPQVPMGGGSVMRGPGSSHEIGEAMRVTGQSRNLSMGLLFSKDGDKIEFGNPRMHYKDKISSKEANY